MEALGIVSAYLRPYRRNDDVFVDIAAMGRHVRLDAHELAVLSALWPPASPSDALARVRASYGTHLADQALERLAEQSMVFRSEQAMEAALDEALDTGLPETPFVDQIELTNHCPMRCGFCPRGQPGRMQRPKGFMEPSLFELLLSQLSPTQPGNWRLKLHHLGESLLHPSVVPFVAKAAQAGLMCELSVNPSLLTPELATDLIEAGLGRLVVSLDGMDQDTLGALRGSAARYDRAERNLDHLVELVAARQRPPQILIQMLRLQRNAHQRGAFLRRWGESDLPTVRAVIQDLEGSDPDLGHPTCAPPTYLCASPWRSVVVLWDGRVVCCCRDEDAHLVLGDLARLSLRDIWQGPVARNLRAMHRVGASTPAGHLCASCSWSRRLFAANATARHPQHARPDPYRW